MDKKKYEYRAINITITEDASEGYEVEGKAICFNSETVLWVDRFGTEYKEIIAPGALDGVDLSDVPLKYNHSHEKASILARVRDGSLKLELKEDGLYFRAKLLTNLGEDVYKAIKAGDVSKCSFAFICDDESYDENTNTRTVKHIQHLGDISIVDEPAYNATSVEARCDNMPEFVKKIEQEKEQEYRKRLILLTQL